MNITEAVLEAEKVGRGITRKKWGHNPLCLVATNTTGGFLIVYSNDRITQKWQPLKEDLIATDWYVYG